MKNLGVVMANFKCYVYYILILLVDGFRNPNLFAKITPSQKIIDQAWKDKNERFLWQTLSKYPQDICKVILFSIFFIYCTIFRPGSDFFSIVMRIVGWSCLYLILVGPPLILLGKFFWKRIIFNSTKPWDLKLSYFLTKLFVEELEEESRGDLTEARNKLVKQGYSRWLVSLITLIRALKICFYFWLSKFQYLANNFLLRR
ncbi:hypothetical protein [Okeania sp.]|uniref:hypothetical protein n=1 Tax=Okeania sp. TaxID=3100323 RepID=UPI002B4B0D20|nr:hypothetical protein [Okeania sp.]MEB3341551.1 hypothetical protein [Okeania sp.]